MGLLRYFGLKITVKRITRKILEEADNRVINGLATDTRHALKQLSNDVPDDWSVETLLLHLVWEMVTRELSFDLEIRSEKNAYNISEIALKEYHRKLKKLKDRSMMGFLKNRAIKKVTKKRFNQLMGLIENDMPVGSDPPIDPMKTLKDYIKAIELSGATIEIPPDITHWWELFTYLVCIMVRSELAYDPTMGSGEDINLILEIANKELEEWKKESVLKKFARRNMIISMGDKFLKRY